MSFAGDGDGVGEDFLQRAPNAAQELRKVGLMVFSHDRSSRRATSGRKMVVGVMKVLGCVEPV